MSGSGRESLPDIRRCSGGPPGCPIVVETTSRMALTNIQEWSGRPSECPRVFGRPSRMSGIGQETIRNVRE